MTPYVFTSIVTNYIPKARVLANSLKRFHPEIPFVLVLSDAIPEWLDLAAEPFDEILTIEDLGIPEMRQWIFQHSIVEVSTGVKGFALLDLLSRPDCSAAIYFDPDIAALSPVDSILDAVARHSIVLTPHLTTPESTIEAIMDNEICSLKHGVFNLGFLAVGKTAEGMRFANWWKDRLTHFCYADIPNGLFTDQRWIDLAPAFFEDICILREPVYNVSTWNLSNRTVEGTLRDGLTIDGKPIIFYHFSGFDSGAQLSMLDKYAARMHGLYELRSWYLDECDRQGQARYGKHPWAFESFDNGQPITDAHRLLYRTRGDLRSAFPDPYATGNISQSYYHWYNANIAPTMGAESAPQDQEDAPALPGPWRSAGYRVYLCILTGDDAGAWLRQALERTYEREAVAILASPDVLPALKARIGRSDLEWIAVPGSQVEDHFAAVLGHCGGSDFAFLASTASVPLLWDLRLFWSALRIRTAGTVSPLTPHSVPALSGTGFDQADHACYRASGFEIPSWKSVVLDCCFIRASALGPQPAATVSGLLKSVAAARFEHVLADHMFVGTARSRDLRICGSAESDSRSRLLEVSRKAPLDAFLARVTDFTQRTQPLSALVDAMRPRHLHVMNNWGGGLERWVREYCRADTHHENFVLRSVGTWGSFGAELRLYQHIDDEQPLEVFPLSPPIKATDETHLGYRAALASILRKYGIEQILVSSFIGHSLDVLGAGVPALVVCHDYYPFCPAINLVFGDRICTRCNDDDLRRCQESNPHNRFFLNVPPPVWMQVREAFAAAVQRNGTKLVAPTPAVRKHLSRFLPSIREHLTVIPHGTRTVPGPRVEVKPESSGDLTIVMLGALAPHKGMDLLDGIAAHAPSGVRLHLLGCGDEAAKRFAGNPRVMALPEYEWDRLGDLVRGIRPDVGLLLSITPETFSYTLQEMFDLALPPLCTNVGSFADRIQDGVNGFLAEPSTGAILERIKELAADRESLVRVNRTLAGASSRSLEAMLSDYRDLMGTLPVSSEAYFASGQSPARDAAPAGRIQVYWRTRHAQFREENSAFAPFTPSTDRQVIRVRIPALPDLPAECRVDPGAEPRLVHISGLRLYSAAGECVWQAPLKEIPRWSLNEMLIMESGEDGVLACCTGPDPNLCFPVNADTATRLLHGGVLEITMSLPSAAQALPVLVRSAAQGSNNGHVSAADEAVKTILSNEQLGADRLPERPVSPLAMELAASRARIRDMENSLSWKLSAPLRVCGKWLIDAGLIRPGFGS